MTDELMAQFLIEGPEMAQAGAEALLELERRPDDRAALDAAFRAVHTLKGSVGLFDLPAMAAALHAAEDVLEGLRSGERALDAEVIGALLAVLTQAEFWLAGLQSAQSLPADAGRAAEALVSRLRAGSAQTEADAPALAEPWAEALVEALAPDAAGPVVAVRYRPAPDSYFAGDDPMAIVEAAPGLIALRVGLGEADVAAGDYDPFTCRLVIELVSSAPAEAVKAAFRFSPDQIQLATVAPRPPAGPAEAKPGAGGGGRILRVDAERVDALAALVDDLAAAKSGLADVAGFAAAGAEPRAIAERLAGQLIGLDRLVAQVHQGVTALRMAPVGPLLRRFPRVARELAADLGKDVELVIEDVGVEADRRIVEGLFEPLTHLIRNAIDHGVEDPAGRRRAGKPPRGRIVLSVRQSGARLVIALADDGRGIDPVAIRSAVAARGLIEADRLAAMSDAEAIELVFLPGFSTAAAVTALSGRGVGMDAVRAAVQRLGGRVGLASRRGAGATVELVLPRPWS